MTRNRLIFVALLVVNVTIPSAGPLDFFLQDPITEDTLIQFKSEFLIALTALKDLDNLRNAKISKPKLLQDLENLEQQIKVTSDLLQQISEDLRDPVKKNDPMLRGKQEVLSKKREAEQKNASNYQRQLEHLNERYPDLDRTNEPQLISSSDISKIENICNKLLYTLLYLNNFNSFTESPIEKLDKKTRQKLVQSLHPDKFLVPENNEQLVKVFQLLGSWDNPELTIMVKQGKLIKHSIEFVQFLDKLKERDFYPSIVPQKEINNAKKLWLALESIDVNCLEKMDKKIQERIEQRLKGNNWTQTENKAKIADFSQFIYSLESQIKFSQLQKLQATFAHYLKRLKITDNTNTPISDMQIATVKKLWHTIISLDDKNKSIQDMDSEFQEQIRVLTFNWQKINQKQMNTVFGILKSPESTASLKVFYEPQTEFLRHLKVLQEVDQQSKIIADADIAKLNNLWNKLKVQHQGNSFFQNMDEEFHITTKIYSFPHNWKMDNNRTKITNFFKEDALERHSKLSTLSSPPQSLKEKATLAIRFFIDPCYSSYAKATLTPQALNRRITSALLNLRTSSIPEVSLEEIQHLGYQMKLLKRFYNYNWLDQILYPFHRNDVETLLTDFPVFSDEQLLKDIHPDTFKDKGYSQQDMQKVTDIFTAIDKLKQNLLERPAKPLEVIFWRGMTDEGMGKHMRKMHKRITAAPFCFLNKLFPGFLRTQQEKFILSALDQKIENQKQENALGKQSLQQRKEVLHIEISRFKLKSAARSRFATI